MKKLKENTLEDITKKIVEYKELEQQINQINIKKMALRKELKILPYYKTIQCASQIKQILRDCIPKLQNLDYHTDEIYNSLLQNDINMAYACTHDLRDTPERRLMAFKCLISNFDKFFNAFEHLYYYRNRIEKEELDLLWTNFGDIIYSKITNSPHKLYIFFKFFTIRLSYEQLKTLTARLIGRKSTSEIKEILRYPILPPDLKEQMEAFLLAQKLIK